MGRLARQWYRLRESFWFLPGMIVLAATALAIVAIEADARFVSADALTAWPRMFAAGSSASRDLLAAVAGSMITVAGTVFSITLVALSLAASQYSSRVLRNFMRDRTNQAVLGVFVGIFAYCLVVLRSIHGNGEDAFVPSVAVLLGLLLGFGGIGVLVFFIHHIAQSIQASQILAAVRIETCGAIERVFPHGVDANSRRVSSPSGLSTHTLARADTTGYLQVVDYARLRDIACRHGLHLEVRPRIGDYVIDGDILVSASKAPPSDFDEDLGDCWMIGPQRTLEQDIGFGIRQLVDVALKALSPGVNDTTTATMCVDALTAVLVQLSARDLHFHDCERHGEPWVQAHHPRFADLLGEAFDQIRHAARDNIAVLERLRWSLATLQGRTHLRERRECLKTQAQRLGECVQRELRDPHDQARLQLAIDELLRALDGPAA